VRCLGLRVEGIVSRVYSLRFMFRVQGSGFRIQGLWTVPLTEPEDPNHQNIDWRPEEEIERVA
jgi:hypothetical protein